MARNLAWFVLVAATAACASGPANRISEGHEGAPGVLRVLLCPPNLVLGLRAEIASGSKPIDREVTEYLESLGRKVERISLIEGRLHWKQAVVEAKAAGAIKSAAGIFVDRLGQDREFDAVVMPSLILITARMNEGYAAWDGVSRRMRVANAPSKVAGREDSTLAKGISVSGLSAPAWVTSLHVLVFARDGSRVFEGRGGIDFVQEVYLPDQGRKFRYELRPNSSIFRDGELLREGVVNAFTPYLVAPDE